MIEKLSVINGTVEDLYNSKTEEEAKKEFKERLENFLEGEIDYYRELSSMLDDLNWNSMYASEEDCGKEGLKILNSIKVIIEEFLEECK